MHRLGEGGSQIEPELKVFRNLRIRLWERLEENRIQKIIRDLWMLWKTRRITWTVFEVTSDHKDRIELEKGIPWCLTTRRSEENYRSCVQRSHSSSPVCLLLLANKVFEAISEYEWIGVLKTRLCRAAIRPASIIFRRQGGAS